VTDDVTHSILMHRGQIGAGDHGSMKQARLLTFNRAQVDQQMARVARSAQIRGNLSDYRIV
jgi:hypothetical protein